jgi:hypothetical protein
MTCQKSDTSSPWALSPKTVTTWVVKESRNPVKFPTHVKNHRKCDRRLSPRQSWKVVSTQVMKDPVKLPTSVATSIVKESLKNATGACYRFFCSSRYIHLYKEKEWNFTQWQLTPKIFKLWKKIFLHKNTTFLLLPHVHQWLYCNKH